MNLIDYVNINLGTDSIYRQSKGNTLPHVQVPFARQSFVMQTDFAQGGWFYNPRVDFTEGIRMSSQPSPWLGDYGHIVFLPFSGENKIENFNRHSAITKKELKPNYMQFYLTRYNIMTKIAPTLSGGICNIEYEKNESKKLLIDMIDGENEVNIQGNIIKISTTNVPSSELGYHKNFKKYYTFESSSDIISYKVYKNEEEVNINQGVGLKLVVEFADKKVDVKVTTSYISNEVAYINLKREMQDMGIDDVVYEGAQIWNKYLASIEIEEEDSKKEFYSNMYRLFLYPRQVHELDEKGIQVYRSFFDGEIKKGQMISDVGFWDTYRTTMPLLRIITPNKYKEIVRSVLNFYKDYGWLPRWIAPFERGIMPSTLVDSVVAEAIVTNNIDEDQIDLAIEALLKDGEISHTNSLHGRKNLEEYKEFGYVPYTKTHESVSMTLDNAYSDYSIYKALNHIGHKDAQKYLKRSKSYENLFNKETLFFESKDEKGKFKTNYDPNTWGDDFCESSGWQNRFSVFHDFENLIKLYGQEQILEKKMDELINSKAEYKIGKYGFEIHEMTEMAVCEGIGYLAISNQPSFHLPYVYLKLGKENKTKETLKKVFKYFTVDNYPGDEDNGSLAAWYILSQIGLYPYCPVDGEFLKFKGFVNYKINQVKQT